MVGSGFGSGLAAKFTRDSPQENKRSERVELTALLLLARREMIIAFYSAASANGCSK